jgi:hypothetical protein
MGPLVPVKTAYGEKTIFGHKKSRKPFASHIRASLSINKKKKKINKTNF